MLPFRLKMPRREGSEISGVVIPVVHTERNVGADVEGHRKSRGSRRLSNAFGRYRYADHAFTASTEESLVPKVFPSGVLLVPVGVRDRPAQLLPREVRRRLLLQYEKIRRTYIRRKWPVGTGRDAIAEISLDSKKC